MSIVIARDQVHEPLYAIVPYFNPWRHKSRVKHTERALKHFHDAGAVIVLVEAGFNRRDLVFADSGLDGKPAECGILGSDPRYRHKYIGLHTKDELWLKENLINIGVQSLPYDWQQVCWLDSDVHFVRPNWVGECIHKLQHYKFLQMFSDAHDLGPTYSMMPETYPHAIGLGFVEAWNRGELKTTLTPQIREDLEEIGGDLAKLLKDFEKLEEDLENPYPGIGGVFPGLAWACTREAWDAVGGLIDVAIWGGGDFHISQALIENTKDMVWPALHRNYRKIVWQWYYSARDHIRRNVGVMSGTILHNWHGRKVERGYGSKHTLLAKLGFDPPRHLRRDHQGLWQLNDDGSEAFVQLRDNMRRIAASRNEDSIDTGIPMRPQGH
jgi:hypothetical protein